MMRDSPAWQSFNEQYLADAIAWIGARLERLAADDRAVREGAGMGQGSAVHATPRAQAVSPVAPVDPDRQTTTTATTTPATPAVPAMPSTPTTFGSPSRWLLERLRGLTVVTDSPARASDLAEVRAAARAASRAPAWDGGQAPALIELARRLGLSEFEREVVLLALAAQLDPGVASLCARVQRTPARPQPTLALALALFDHPAWDAMAPGRPLRFWQLLGGVDDGGEPHSLAASGLRADPRIVRYVKGQNYLDERIAALVTPLTPASLAPSTPAAGLPPLHARVAAGIERALSAADGTGLPVCQLSGTDGASKRLVALHVARTRQLTPYSLLASALPDSLAQVDLLARLWRRESLLLPLALYIEVDQNGCPSQAPAAVHQHAALRRFLQHCGGLVLLDSEQGWHDAGRLTLPWELAPACAAEHHAA